MTEEIIENEEVLPQKADVSAGKMSFIDRIKKLGKKSPFKNRKPKGPDALNDFDRAVVWITGIVTFGGVLFCVIMIILMTSLGF